MERTLYLCFACAADMTQGYDLEELPGQPESMGRNIPHKGKK